MKMIFTRKLFASICAILSILLILCACDTSSADKDNGTEAGTVAETQGAAPETTPDTKPADTEPSTEYPTENDPEPETEPGIVVITYTVTLLNEAGEPIANAGIQFCQGDYCMPGFTDANGVATFTALEADYTVTILAAEGYNIDGSYTFPEGSTSLTITLTAAE